MCVPRGSHSGTGGVLFSSGAAVRIESFVRICPHFVHGSFEHARGLSCDMVYIHAGHVLGMDGDDMLMASVDGIWSCESSAECRLLLGPLSCFMGDDISLSYGSPTREV